MTSGPFAAALLAMAALVLVLLPGASAQNPSWTSFLTKDLFNKQFPNRVAFYTYEAFVKAGASPYANFGTQGSQDDRKRELAAFLANIKHESGGTTIMQLPSCYHHVLKILLTVISVHLILQLHAVHAITMQIRCY